MGNENKCYLLVRSNPCCHDSDEYIGVFEKLELVRQYANSLIELKELQERGFYPNFELYIYEFKKNMNDEGHLVKLKDLDVGFEI